MIRAYTALHLNLSPQEGGNASSFGICRGRNSNRLTTRWSGPRIQRQKQEKAQISVRSIASGGSIPGRLSRTRWLAVILCLLSNIEYKSHY